MEVQLAKYGEEENQLSMGVGPSQDLCCAARIKDQSDVQHNSTEAMKKASLDELYKLAVERYDQWQPATTLTDAERNKMYALQQQANYGDVTGDRPPFYRRLSRAQWDAWARLEAEMPQDRAKVVFMEEVNRMIQKHGTL